MVAFEVKRQGEKQEGINLRGVARTTKNFCSFTCFNKDQCVSFTFCSPRSCFLNLQDISSVAAVFATIRTCIYVERNSSPNQADISTNVPITESASGNPNATSTMTPVTESATGNPDATSTMTPITDSATGNPNTASTMTPITESATENKKIFSTTP